MRHYARLHPFIRSILQAHRADRSTRRTTIRQQGASSCEADSTAEDPENGRRAVPHPRTCSLHSGAQRDQSCLSCWNGTILRTSSIKWTWLHRHESAHKARKTATGEICMVHRGMVPRWRVGCLDELAMLCRPGGASCGVWVSTLCRSCGRFLSLNGVR